MNTLRVMPDRQRLAVQQIDWKRRADVDRAREAELELDHRSKLARTRANAFEWGVPANDNQAWPLAAQLRKDGRDRATAELIDDHTKDLLSTAERYVALYEAAIIQAPLIGNVPDDFMPLVQNGNGERNKGAKRIAAAPPVDDGCFRTVPHGASDDGGALARRTKPVAKKWNGDNLLIGSIDARRDLGRVRAGLGPLEEDFEAAVLYGETLTAIGQRHGIGQAAGGAGKALVYLGLKTAKREFHLIDTERRVQAAHL